MKHPSLVLVALAFSLFIGANTAHAGGMTASIDAGPTFLEQEGFDIGVRGGWTFELGNFHLTPEIGERLLTTQEAEPFIGSFVGVRLSHGHTFSPGVYGSFVGWTSDGSTSATGGVTFDVRALPKLVIGVHSGYTTHLFGDFITVGGHAGFQM